MKRRALVIPLAGIMLAALAVPALAGETTINSDSVSETIEVTGRYASGGTATATVYSVDIEWGSMIFEYVSTGSKVWDPKTHDYISSTSSQWRPAAREEGATIDSNAIKVTNHSNTDVNCSLAFQASTWFQESSPVGTFEQDVLGLESAVGKATNAADTKETKLTITSNDLESGMPLDRSIGTIYVTLK